MTGPARAAAERVLRGALLALVAAATVVRVHNAFVYPVRLGHDSRSHAQYLTALLDFGKVHNRVEYCLPQGYLWTALHGWLVRLVSSAEGAALQHAALGIGNCHLYAWFLGGLYVLARRLGLGATTSLAFLALTTTSPVVQRTLDMLRPENLALAFLPWILAWAVGVADDLRADRRPAGLGFAVLLGVVFSEKIGGFTIVLALGLGLLLVRGAPLRRKVLAAARIGAVVALVAVPLFLAHRVMVGRWFFQHPTFTDRKLGVAYDHHAPRSFYWPIRAGDIWQNPVRERQRGSMWGILAADLYGDYWQYGPDHKRFRRPAADHLRWQRVGLVLTVLFLGLFVAGLVDLALRARAGPEPGHSGFVLTQALLLPGGALAYMALTCQVGFEPLTANLIKWEYVGWILPLLALPIALLTERGRPAWLRVGAMVAVLLLCCVGLMRSLVLPP